MLMRMTVALLMDADCRASCNLCVITGLTVNTLREDVCGFVNSLKLVEILGLLDSFLQKSVYWSGQQFTLSKSGRK